MPKYNYTMDDWGFETRPSETELLLGRFDRSPKSSNLVVLFNGGSCGAGGLRFRVSDPMHRAWTIELKTINQ